MIDQQVRLEIHDNQDKPSLMNRAIFRPSDMELVRGNGMAERIATTDEFAPGGASPLKLNTIEEIRDRFDQNVRNAEAALSKMTEDSANGNGGLFSKAKRFSASGA